MIGRKCMIYNEDMSEVVIGDVVSIEYEPFSVYSSPRFKLDAVQSRCADVPMLEKDITRFEKRRDELRKEIDKLKCEKVGIIKSCEEPQAFDWSYE